MLIFHNGQHGTAVVVLAALINASKVVGKKLKDLKIVINGAGAAGTAISSLLKYWGVNKIIVCDRKGTIFRWRKGLNLTKKILAKNTNPDNVKGSLENALKGSDIFIGVSVAKILTPEMIPVMNKNPIIFAMANPEPEIMPELAQDSGVKVIATGRSDYPNQVNNVLAFPGIFRGALDSKARDINMEMKVAAAESIASLISGDLSKDYIIPKVFDERILPAVAVSVAEAAEKTGSTTGPVDKKIIEEKAKSIAGNINTKINVAAG
jgi:malate dehydrogenase (oxaloacetate-decarboxylating)